LGQTCFQIAVATTPTMIIYMTVAATMMHHLLIVN